MTKLTDSDRMDYLKKQTTMGLLQIIFLWNVPRFHGRIYSLVLDMARYHQKLKWLDAMIRAGKEIER